MGQCRTPGSGDLATAGWLFSVVTSERLAVGVVIQMEPSTLAREPGSMPDLHFVS